MRRNSHLWIAGLAALLALPGRAQQPHERRPGLGGSYLEITTPEELLRMLEEELKATLGDYEVHKARVNAGVETPGQLPQLEASIRQLEVRIGALRSQIEQMRRIEKLRRPVDVNLKDATVEMAAKALSEVSGLNVRVDPGVSKQIRLTVAAHGVPLSMVVETIAMQANLRIGTLSEDGRSLTLSRWPSLEVNGQTRVFRGPFAPWADEWRGVFDSSPILWQVIRGENAFQSPAMAPLQPVMSAPAMGHPNAGPMEVFVPNTMRSVNSAPAHRAGRSAADAAPLVGAGKDLVAIAESGAGPKGETGYWLTVYRLGPGGLTRAGSAFHRTAVPLQKVAPPPKPAPVQKRKPTSEPAAESKQPAVRPPTSVEPSPGR
jgi:hypothetical protein